MTVKVVGFDEKTKQRKTCRNCGAIVEFVPADVQEHRGTDYSGGPDGHKYVRCPKCKECITWDHY